ncbi:MAG: hypothetical protein AAFO03_15860 [Bacteroidota bacterium]
MANVAKNQTQDKLATILADYPYLLTFIEKGENLEYLESIVAKTSPINFVPSSAIREISKIVKLGADKEITRSDLYAAYCLGRVESSENHLASLVKLIKSMGAKIDEEGFLRPFTGMIEQTHQS